jgi:AmiR/NasT family two-component response regulator
VAAQLQAALTHRAVIDQALGILMSRAGCSAADAFDRLRRMSQTENVKVHDLAERTVAEAIRRARARHTSPDQH